MFSSFFRLKEDFKILKQGAEAKIYTCTYLGMPTVVKERFIKNYRHPDLDTSITRDRIKNEARSIVRCMNVGLKTPCLYLVDLQRRRIYMEYFEQSMSVKDYFITVIKKHENKNVDITNLIKSVTSMIGRRLRCLHDYNIIHGDLTTSNMLLIPRCPTDVVKVVNWIEIDNLELALIDFGLSHIDSSAEDKGVDLYVLERALISTHNDLPDLFELIMEAYVRNKGKHEDVAETLSKLEEVRARGRKRTMVG